MVVNEFDMTNRFLENSVYLDIPLKYLLLAQCHCLVMYTLKLILKKFRELTWKESMLNMLLLEMSERKQ